MTRVELEKHLYKNVKITLFDGEVIVGELHKTGDGHIKDDPNLTVPKNYYYCDSGTKDISCIFKVFHIKKLKVL